MSELSSLRGSEGYGACDDADAPLWTLPPKRQLHSFGAMSLIYALCCHFAAAVRRLMRHVPDCEAPPSAALGS